MHLCVYCDKAGHMEDECRTLMKDSENGRRTVSQIIECLMSPSNSKEDTRRKPQVHRRENQTVTRKRCNAKSNKKKIDASTIGHYRSKLITSYKNVVEIKVFWFRSY